MKGTAKPALFEYLHVRHMSEHDCYGVLSLRNVHELSTATILSKHDNRPMHRRATIDFDETGKMLSEKGMIGESALVAARSIIFGKGADASCS